MSDKKKDIKDKKGASSKGDAFSFDPSLPLENENHERFLMEVLNRKPNVRAYQLAYPGTEYFSAAANSCRLLKEAKTKARLEYLKEEQRNRLKLSADDIIMRLEMAANFDPADLFDSAGVSIPINNLPPEIRLCIEKIEYDEVTIGEGENKKTIGRTAKVQTISKKSALELLGKSHKLFTDKVEVEASETLAKLLKRARERVNGKR